jgi:hypothetical protein
VVLEDIGGHKNAADCGGLELVNRSLLITREWQRIHVMGALFGMCVILLIKNMKSAISRGTNMKSAISRGARNRVMCKAGAT